MPKLNFLDKQRFIQLEQKLLASKSKITLIPAYIFILLAIGAVILPATVVMAPAVAAGVDFAAQGLKGTDKSSETALRSPVRSHPSAVRPAAVYPTPALKALSKTTPFLPDGFLLLPCVHPESQNSPTGNGLQNAA